MEVINKDGTKEVYTDYASKGVANTALGLGIAGTALGLMSVAKNGFNLFGGSSSSSPENVNINTYTSAPGATVPTVFQTWEKESEDALALTKALYQGRITNIQEMQAARQIDIDEKFKIWKSQVDGDFGLYKSTRDAFDAMSAKQNSDAFNLYKNQRDSYDILSSRISALETKQAVADAVEPWRAQVLDMRINGVASGAQAAVNLEAERRSCADGKIVNYVNSTFYPIEVAEITTGSTATAKSTYNPLCGCYPCA